MITSDKDVYSANGQTLTCTVLPNGGNGLDHQFPIDTGLSTADSPALGLPSPDSEVTRSDTFKMYFMWRPGLSNDIPVPLGNVTWQIFGDAVQNNGTWTVQSDSGASDGTFASGAVYPSWGPVIPPNATPTCH